MGLFDELRRRPVIAAARDGAGLSAAIASPSAAVFLLGGTILSLPDAVSRVQNVGKRAFVHIDLIEGLGHDAAAVDWCAANARPDGLISTRQPLLRRARELGLACVQRVFVMDSSSVLSALRLVGSFRPDMLELLPGLMPKLIAQFSGELPGSVIIAGGLITQAAEVKGALDAGALAVSTGARALWDWTPEDRA